MSRYHVTPVIYESENVVVVHEGDEISLFEQEQSMHFYEEGEFEKAWRFRTKNLPAAGALPGPADNTAQITF